jgi:hypothetical protein
VSHNTLFVCFHTDRFRRFGLIRQLPNCRI